MKQKKKRADELLVAQNLAKDKKEAQALILAGKVVAGEQRVDKPSELLPEPTLLRVKFRGKYVSRGGAKLEGAINCLGLQTAFFNAIALDIGASTGGFTHCLLNFGVKQVIALDVGSNQLAWSIRQNPKVVPLEKTDIRLFDPTLFPVIDWIVADISFNSLARLAEPIFQAGGENCRYLIMIKPQFELPSSEVPKGGVVTDAELRKKAVERVKQVFTDLGLEVYEWVDSPLPGRMGNQEVFLYMGKKTGKN